MAQGENYGNERGMAVMNDRAEFTAIDSYNIVKEVTSTSSAPTTFPFGITSGDMDLLSATNGGKGTETKAYRLEILMTGTVAGTGTVVITGASEGGPEEQICSVAISSAADIVETGAFRIIDTMVLTQTHLAACSIVVADSGNSRPAKLGFDAVGYRFINFYIPVLTNITDLRIYVRFF